MEYKAKLEVIESLVKELGYENIDIKQTAIEILKMLNEKSLTKLSETFKPDNISF
jgi:hypothetical protein